MVCKFKFKKMMNKRMRSQMMTMIRYGDKKFQKWSIELLKIAINSRYMIKMMIMLMMMMLMMMNKIVSKT